MNRLSKEDQQKQRAAAQKQKEMREAFLYFRKENVLLRKAAKKEYIEHNKKILDLYMKGEIGPDYDENRPPDRKASPVSMERMFSYGYTKKTGGSHYYYCWVLSVAQREFRQLLSFERQRPGLKSCERKELFAELAEFYFMYVRLYRVMDEVYDQIAHPQKREIRKILDFLILRTMEIRNTIFALDNSEYIYFDDITVENNWTPDETTMEIPRYYFYDQPPEIKEREQWIAEFREKAPTSLEPKQSETAIAAAKKKKKFKDHVHIVDWPSSEIPLTIQKYERHRQALEDYRFMVFLSEDDAREAAKKKREKERESADKDKAATIIQKLVRGFLARRRVYRIRLNEATFLGLAWGGETVISGWDEKCQKACSTNHERLEFLMERRRRYRRTLEDLYQKARIATENRIRTFEAPEMAERLSYQLRKWMLNVKEKSGKLPDIPKAEHGGISLLVCPSKLPADVLEKGLETLDPELAKRKKKDKKKAADKKKKDAAKAKAKDKKKKKDSGPQPLALNAPPYFEEMVQANREYNSLWRLKDEKSNPEQKHEDYLVTKEKRKLVMWEVRQQVDNVLRSELQVLKQALEGKKKKKGKGKKGKGKKGKGKGKGKKGKKMGKDLTPDRTFRSLYEDMIANGLIKSYPKVRLNDMFGCHSLVNGTIRNYWAEKFENPLEDPETKFTGDANPLPSLGDVKRAIKDIAIIPMGSESVHAMGQFNKSLLIAGPNGAKVMKYMETLFYEAFSRGKATKLEIPPGYTISMAHIGTKNSEDQNNCSLLVQYALSCCNSRLRLFYKSKENSNPGSRDFFEDVDKMVRKYRYRIEKNKNSKAKPPVINPYSFHLTMKQKAYYENGTNEVIQYRLFCDKIHTDGFPFMKTSVDYYCPRGHKIQIRDSVWLSEMRSTTFNEVAQSAIYEGQVPCTHTGCKEKVNRSTGRNLKFSDYVAFACRDEEPFVKSIPRTIEIDGKEGYLILYGHREWQGSFFHYVATYVTRQNLLIRFDDNIVTEKLVKKEDFPLKQHRTTFAAYYFGGNDLK